MFFVQKSTGTVKKQGIPLDSMADLISKMKKLFKNRLNLIDII